jgi:putative hydrolase of the HAD superfamily
VSNQVVFWDFDGTLAHRPGMWSACLLDCLTEVSPRPAGVRLEDLRPLLRTGFPWHEHERGHEHLDHPDAWWSHLEALFADVLRRLGVPAPVAQEAARSVRLRYTDPLGWAVFPEAPAALAAVAGAGWRNAILSNHVPELAPLVRKLGLGEHVDAVFSSAAIGWEKPHPKAFRHALQAMGEPASAWMVGDSPRADVGGAQAAGMPAILVAPGAGDARGLLFAARTILTRRPRQRRDPEVSVTSAGHAVTDAAAPSTTPASGDRVLGLSHALQPFDAGGRRRTEFSRPDLDLPDGDVARGSVDEPADELANRRR